MRDENEKRKPQYPIRRESDDSLQAAKHQSRLPAQIGSNLFLAAPLAWDVSKFVATRTARLTWNVAKLIRDILNSDFVYEHKRQLLAAAAILGVYVALIVILAVSGLSFVQIALFLIVLTFLAGCAVAAKRQEAKEFMTGRKRHNRRRSRSGWRGSQRTNSNLYGGAEASQQQRGKEWFTRGASSNQSRRTSKGVDDAKYVYVISNPKHKGKYKVGVTRNVDNRLNNYQTSDPDRAFKVRHKRLTENYREVEKHIHEAFDNQNEWVQGDLQEIINAIDDYDELARQGGRQR